MTDDTAGAADSAQAQESIIIVGPGTDDRIDERLDALIDAGFRSVGQWEPPAVPVYEPRMDLKLNLLDGTHVSIQDGPGHSVAMELVSADGKTAIDVELSDHDVDHLRMLLLRANLVDGR